MGGKRLQQHDATSGVDVGNKDNGCPAIRLGNYTVMGGYRFCMGWYVIMWDPIAVEVDTNVF